jgi:hypothetical protein
MQIKNYQTPFPEYRRRRKMAKPKHKGKSAGSKYFLYHSPVRRHLVPFNSQNTAVYMLGLISTEFLTAMQ